MKRRSFVAAILALGLVTRIVLASPSLAQERLGAGLLELDTPAGFGRSMQGDVVVFRPVGPTHDCCALVVPPGEETDQTFGDWFDARWSELAGNLASAEVPAPVEDETAEGDARRTIAKALPDGRGRQAIVFLTAIQRGARVQSLVFRGRPELGMEPHLPAIDAAVNSARFRARADWPVPRVVPLSMLVSIAAGGPPGEEAPIAIASERSKGSVPAERALNGVYAGLSLRPAGIGAGGSDEEYAVFFPDGTFLSRLPQEGFMSFDRAVSMREYAGFWGTYEVDGSRVALRYRNSNGNLPATLEPSGRLVVENRWTLGPVPSLDGLRLAGTYARVRRDAYFQSRPIRFTADGTFEDAGAIGEVGLVAPGGMFAEIAPGSGSYRIARNTLRLDYASGYVEVSIIALPDDLATGSPRTIFVNKHRLDRVD